MKIEKFILDQDTKIVCLTAESFPAGIAAAHVKLHEIIPGADKRRAFGISRPENGSIVYKAAVEALEDGEAEKYQLESFVIKNGEFISMYIKDNGKDIQGIGAAFKELLAQPTIDPNGYCLEWYIDGKDVRCMVPLKTS